MLAWLKRFRYQARGLMAGKALERLLEASGMNSDASRVEQVLHEFWGFRTVDDVRVRS
jgi:hypothetical protein